MLYDRGSLAVLGCEFVIWFAGGRGSLVVLCDRGLLAVLGCKFVIWVVGCGWLFQFLDSAMERQR